MPRINSFWTSSLLREILHNAPKPFRFSWLLRDTNQSGALWAFWKWQNVPNLSAYTHKRKGTRKIGQGQDWIFKSDSSLTNSFWKLIQIWMTFSIWMKSEFWNVVLPISQSMSWKGFRRHPHCVVMYSEYHFAPQQNRIEIDNIGEILTRWCMK